jgi:TPR repeat protein
MVARIRTAPKVLVLAVLLIAAHATPAKADYEGGQAAYESGDYAVALQELEPLALQGDARAQFRLGVMYQSGEGIPQDEPVGARWLLRAAAQGHAGAHYALYFAYSGGRGLPADEAKALYSLRRAAELGEPEAQYKLALMHGKGEGVPRDVVSAYVWFDLAAAQGWQEAARKRRFIAERMTREELAEARSRAKELRRKTQPAKDF